MKTILHISKYYYPDLGGIENVAQQLAEGLTDYRNVVVCFSHDGKTYYDTVNDIHVIRVGVLFSVFSQDVSLSYYSILKKAIRDYKPDAVHVHCPNPFVYPLILSLCKDNIKLVLHWHSDILGKGIVYHMIKGFERKLVERADYILVTSPNYIEPSQPLNGYKEKIRILPNAVQTSMLDLREGDKDAISKIRELYKGKRLVFVVGRHVPYKGLDKLIESERYIKSDVQILIAGSGPETDNLKKIAKGKERISFVGRLTADELRQYMWASEVLGFSSNTKAEAFGIALAEGMYCKTVPVTFTIEGSGVNWVSVNGETGTEVPLNDSKAYAKAIDEILSSPELLQLYAEASRKRVEKYFTQEKAVSEANKIYKDILSI